MERYPNISDHGLIGDLQTAALVSTDGTVDWFCCPRFDSPSVFAALLDADKGGHFRLAPDREYVSRQLYFPDTAVLITRFLTPDGVGEVHDFMPVAGKRVTDRHRLVRQVRVVRGTMRFVLDIQPRFDYARVKHTVHVTADGAAFVPAGAGAIANPPLTLHIAGSNNHSLEESGVSIQRAGDGITAARTLKGGQTWGVVLESGTSQPARLHTEDIGRLLHETTGFWRGWLDGSTYRGRWREMVTRSAMTLKLMQYAPTGALVAAPTAALPEQAGGGRNWDYRYTWIRDGSFSIYALLGLGFTEEAEAFAGWLRDRASEQAGGVSGPLRIMYRVDGSSDLTEEILDHFEGWRGSKPVRIGNGAADQLQLDIYGEAMDAVYLADRDGVQVTHRSWLQIANFIDWLCEHWDQPDEGIWETRGGRKDFVYGRMQTWVALDRAVKMALNRGRPAEVSRWVTERDAVYRQVFDKGWNPEIGGFTQHYGSDVLDSSLLMMPLQGFIAPRDPMWLSTLKAIDRELVSDSLVYRYNPSASPDGLAGNEGTFSLCTFWYVDALARAGRLDEARLTFEKMHTYANHLGLYSEEIGSTGEQLGNFPQAFSHLALISAAVNLDHQLDHGAGKTPGD
ncbi:MAG TPA: glycoside hydrolase family 15 protein [Trebonia sp.]|jgi:GH15 family glucan-1,4-alpha-glucosidase|nr:glycoside hydrolase family 15 protein [Trebonia sp.]